MVDIIANVIAVVSVVVTGIFSWLVYKATKATQRVAEETFSLNKRLIEEENKRVEEHRKIMRLQLSQILLKEISEVELAMASTDPMYIYNALKKAPIKSEVQIQDLADFFLEDEIKMINRAWNSYDVYRNNYYRKSYPGTEITVLVEKAPPVLEDINNLRNTLINI